MSDSEVSLAGGESTLPSSVPSPELLKLTLAELTEENKEKAVEIKAEANKAFVAHEFKRAADLYTQALDHNPFDATLWCNRAYARIKLEEHGYAHNDASMLLKSNALSMVHLTRRAQCHLQMLKPQLAIGDFKKVLAIEPHNKSIKQQLEATQKLVRRIEFEKAIEREEEMSAALRCLEIIADGGCELDKTYTGPQLPKDATTGKYTITLEFIREMMKLFKDGKALPKRYVWEITLGAYSVFEKEPSLVELILESGRSVDVIGDVHGQYFDVLKLFQLTGEPTETHPLLMNGDLVDRGSWSVEVILTAFAFKWLYPTGMYVNRGNHETKDMNRTYGFEGEAKHKHGEQTYKLFAHVFTAMPLATLISATKPPVLSPRDKTVIIGPDGTRRYFVVHGGLFSKDGVTLDDIKKIERIGQQPGQEGLMCKRTRILIDLLWTDPQDAPGRGPSRRGVGISFGPDVTKRWCTENKVSAIIRSHEVRQDGYTIEHDGLCITVFSAPNYVDQSGNLGAFIRIDDAGTMEFIKFDKQWHPPLKPMHYAQGGLASMLM
ncbi:protein phosphatase 5 [Thelephora ganbajun]|uniref:Protein phosphatase 5 n=1 Tax=Thelephora ganbajun TaxID=370292 RepID=A0ACB6ZWJ6_THEGA|nr:protein phosphatase 5 [Thelephora ganbajun]